MYSASSADIHHDAKAFRVDGMVQNIKNRLSKEWDMTFL